MSEAQARWYVAKEALARGRGGISAMQELTGMSRPTITKGIHELKHLKSLDVSERVRNVGGGRKRIEHRDPGLSGALESIMAESTAGDPQSCLLWTNKSTAKIAQELSRRGHHVSDETVRRRLLELDYSLQVNQKSLEGSSPANRDEQFRYINALVKQNIAQGQPVLSIDTKKKERIGNFKNPGQAWRLKGDPRRVNVYDFNTLSDGTAAPYGTYDPQRNEGFVNVGTSHDTAAFAVESLRRWWRSMGRRYYPKARRLLLCADGGGSNGSRNRAWKYHLQQLANELAVDISVCHYPPGTSKWNQIEHRMFSFISVNWSGQPLISYETMLMLIGATTTSTGLRIKARLDKNFYPSGETISNVAMGKIKLIPHDVNPLWNYTIGRNSRPQRLTQL